MTAPLQERVQDVPRLALDLREAAASLGISDRTLWALTAPRGPIRAVRVGRRSIRYYIRDLERYLAELPAEGDETQADDAAEGGRP